MKTKYGAEIDVKTMAEYFNVLIGKCFKLLPLYEEQNDNIEIYLKSLLLELCGGNRLIVEDTLFLELINNLESLSLVKNKKTFRSQVLKCTNLCKKISDKLKESVVDGL